MAIGQWETRSEEKILEQKGELDEEGTGLVTRYSYKGEVRSEERYVRGKKHGAWVTYLDGKQIRREEYRDGYLQSVTEKLLLSRKRYVSKWQN